ncbi:DUF4834 family protein [Robiginitalea sp.]|jgi:hypothetical protein|nr:DUF4834 family protein [Robiginitalea sp.]
MGFLRLLFFLLLGYYLLRIIGRLAAPFMVNYAARKSQDIFRKAYEQQQSNSTASQRVGDVIVEKPSDTPRKNSKPVGEYITFEEIE